jgi:PAS domain S-box-containing protein
MKRKPEKAGTTTDITSPKQAEDALRESELKFRTIFESFEDIYYQTDIHGIITLISPSVYRLSGWKPEEVIGQPTTLFFETPGDRSVLMKALAEQGYVRDHELTLLKRDGSRAIASLATHLIYDASGATAGTAGSLRDITERKQVENELRETLKSLKRSQEISHVGNWIWDIPADKFSASDEAFKLMGFPPGFPAKFQDIAEQIHPFDRIHARNVLTASLQTGEPYSIEMRIIKKDTGEIRHILSMAEIERDADGNPLKIFGINQDITERKQAEEELHKEKEFSQTLVQNSPTFFVAIDSTGKTILMNDALLQDLGYTKEEVVGKDYLKTFVPESDRESLSKVFEQLTHLKKNTINENYILAKDGRLLLVEWHGTTVFKEETEFDYFFGVGIDVTERRRLEEEREKLQTQLTQAQKMESVGRLAGGVAHDFNNMLGVILGRAEIAMMRTDPAQPLYKDLQEIRKAAECSADLTRQLLAFARKQTVAPKVLDLNEVIEGMLKMLRRLIGEDIDLVWLPDAFLWPVKMDTTQIDQILANLCVNARDAISGVGKVTIETGVAIFDAAYCANHPGFVPGDYVLLAVSDNGCGIDKDIMDKLFEPFFTTKAVGKGTGLGLATIYGIVKQNNGFINVYSEPGQGTTFRIYLPRYVGKAEQLRTADLADIYTPGNETILLAEDEPAILEMTTMMLQHLGYTVLQAGTPGEAIRLASEHRGQIHLLITDVVMPEMNGRDLARNILSLYPAIKQLFMSGYTANTIAHHGVLDDGVNFIQKPFSLSNLAAKLRETLDKK